MNIPIQLDQYCFYYSINKCTDYAQISLRWPVVDLINGTVRIGNQLLLSIPVEKEKSRQVLEESASRHITTFGEKNSLSKIARVGERRYLYSSFFCFVFSEEVIHGLSQVQCSSLCINLRTCLETRYQPRDLHLCKNSTLRSVRQSPR